MADGRRVVNAVIAPLWEHIRHYTDLQASQNISLSVVVVYIAYRVNNPLWPPTLVAQIQLGTPHGWPVGQHCTNYPTTKWRARQGYCGKCEEQYVQRNEETEDIFG